MSEEEAPVWLLFANLILCCASYVICYPLRIVLAHTLIEIESPQHPSARTNSGYEPVMDDVHENSTIQAGTNEECDEELSPLNQPTQPSVKLLHTRSIRTTLQNLKSVGLKGWFRAIPCQILYVMIHESLWLFLGGLHPTIQLMDRVRGDNQTTLRIFLKPVSILSMILLDVLLIPLDIVITRQLIGKPDAETALGHIWGLVTDVKLSHLLPIVFPQLLCSSLPALLQRVPNYLHYQYLEATLDEPGPLIFFTIIAWLWQCLSCVLIEAPLQACLYRAQTSAIARLPRFESFIECSSHYSSPIASLKEISESERQLTGTWYGRYTRYFVVKAILMVAMSISVFLSLALLVSLWGVAID